MLKDHPIALAFGAIVVFYILRFFRLLHWNRSLYKGLYGPPHSYAFGSLQALGEIVQSQPRLAAPQCRPLLLKEKHNLKDYFYMDPWPFGPPAMVILNTEMMQDIAVKTSLPKNPEVDKFVQHIGGPGNLVTAEGAEWKKWRSAFNPGFSSNYLITLVPLIVGQAMVYVDILTQKTKENALFRMEPLTTKLTVDIIGKVVLDADFNSQRQANELVDALLSQISWQKVGGRIDLSSLDFRRPLIMKYNTWRMNRYIGRFLDERFATRSERRKTKCIIDLALESYLKENKSDADLKAMNLDPAFKEAAISNMKVFIFAGHDTTSSTICYSYYYLSKDPSRMEKAVKELNDVLGPDTAPDAVGRILTQDPHLLNRLEYTTAVIREALRLQPPASTVRQGQKGFFLRDPDTGEQLPTEHFMLFPVDVGIGRSARYWNDRHDFKPERFFDSAGYNKDAWIPFSKGTRNCIGQGLAEMEVKIILAMTVRYFQITSAYAEVEKLRGDGSGYPSDNSGIQTMFGDEAYQVQVGSAKPREGMPVRVSLRK